MISKTEYTPINPDKYVGTYPIVARSSWEITVCRMCDTHPGIVAWSSEPVRIPYRNPLTGKNTTYIPDFLIIYEGSDGIRKAELVEVKPSKETTLANAKSKVDVLRVAVNMAKWEAAQKWANQNGMAFRVINENDIFRNPKRAPKNKRKK